MTKKWFSKIMFGMMIFIFFLIINAPAKLMNNLLTSNVNHLQLQGMSGGFWSGNIHQINYLGHSINNLQWELSLLSLLTGKLGADLIINDQLYNGDLFIEMDSSNNVSLSINQADLSTSEVAKKVPLLTLFNPSGALEIKNVAITANSSTFKHSDGDINWQNARLNFNGDEYNLGSLYFKLNTEDDDLLITISDDKTVLDLQGTLRISPDKKYLLQASLSKSLPPNIYNAVRLVARPDGSDRLSMSIPGKF